MITVCWQTARRNSRVEEIEIRPYKESDWAELARIHDGVGRWNWNGQAFLMRFCLLPKLLVENIYLMILFALPFEKGW